MSQPAFPIVIRLSGEPRGKGRPRFARATGRAYTPADTRRYEAALRFAAQEVMGDRLPIERDTPVFVTVTARMPVPASWSNKKRQAAFAGELWPVRGGGDADNYAKAAGDSLNEVVLVDDKQIVGLTVFKTYSAKPELLIVIRPAERAPSPELP